MMTINISIDEETVKKLISKHIEELLGSRSFDPSKVHIYVKSKQNYKSEWEDAAIKATYIEAES